MPPDVVSRRHSRRRTSLQDLKRYGDLQGKVKVVQDEDC